MKSTSFLSLADLYAPIAADLQATRQVIRDELISDQGFISDLCRHVEQFHGKMVRPAVLLLTAQACGGVRPAHHTLAGVVELVHIATLVHDDILDEADIRRRAATVNRLWGNERAVLMGDFLISHAYHLCSSLDSQYASRLIGRTTNTVCEGEMMQVANRGNFDLSEAEYFDIITRKTAALIGACCELGARYAEAPETTIAALREFGVNIGIAFQIVDDLLDLTGDESQTGKSLGRDVEKGKLTLPLIHFLQTATKPQRARMLALLRDDAAGDATTGPRETNSAHREHAAAQREIAALLQTSESLDYARSIAAEYIAAAQRGLAHLPPSPARDSLNTMAEFVLERRQ